MSRVEQLESDVQRLSAEELAAFRTWFAEFDAIVWDQKFEADALSGKLNALADRALNDFDAGRTKPL
jgi:hypothetical protein